MKSRIIAFLTVFLLLCSCNGQGGDNTSSTQSDSSGAIYDNISLSATSAWSEMSLLESVADLQISAKTTDIKIDGKTGENVYVATKDNGIYISRDSGNNFKNSSAGLLTENIELLAIDPNNNDYILALAIDDSLKEEVKGIYASTNGGRGWQKISTSFSKIQGAKMQIIFDNASYDSSKSNSSIVYITGVTMAGDTIAQGQNALYRSLDGGKTFALASHIRFDSEIAVHTSRGYVYLTDSTGFYRSIDHATNFEMMTGESCTHVYTSSKSPEDVFLAGINGMMISHNSGVSFENTMGKVPNLSEAVIFASFVNEDNLMSLYKTHDGNYDIKYSTDGGASWQIPKIENIHKTTLDEEFKVDFCFSENDASTVMMLYNNEVYKSVDSGANFALCSKINKKLSISSSVNENHAIKGYFAFVVDRDTVAYSFYNGESYKIINVKNLKENEYIASAYLMDKTTLMIAVGSQESDEYTLAFLSVGNDSITRSAFKKLKNPILFGDSNNKNILFAGNFYSTDMGQHWEEMKNCDAVLYQNLVSPGEMFGVKDTKVVMSVDKGKSWIDIFDAKIKVEDIAYDYYEKTIYAVTTNGLLKSTIEGNVENLTNKIPNNSMGEKFLTEVEVDYLYPNIIYVGGKAKEYINDCSIMISVDNGKTWRVISATLVNSNAINCTPTQPIDFTVDSSTRILRAYCGSFGTFEFDITKTQWGK